jgi:hypothetical protein
MEKFLQHFTFLLLKKYSFFADFLAAVHFCVGRFSPSLTTDSMMRHGPKTSLQILGGVLGSFLKEILFFCQEIFFLMIARSKKYSACNKYSVSMFH